MPTLPAPLEDAIRALEQRGTAAANKIAEAIDVLESTDDGLGFEVEDPSVVRCVDDLRQTTARAKAATGTPLGQSRVTTGPLVLYVDDERPNRVVFEHSFAGKFHVKTAASSQEALDVIATEPVAVLLTDQRMPQITGADLLRHVKHDHPEVVRVMITAYTDVEPILTAVNEGLVTRYIIKPWNREELEQLFTEYAVEHAA